MVIKSISGVVCAYLAVVSFSVDAAFVYEGEEISGFNNLEYNGEYWNVTFNEGNYNTNYTDSFVVPEDLNYLNIALSEHVYDLGLESNPDVFIGCSAMSNCQIATPTTTDLPSYGFITASFVNVQSGYVSHGGQQIYNVDTHYANQTWATWEASVVPIPPAVWLFGSGLIGLIGVARRKVNA